MENEITFSHKNCKQLQLHIQIHNFNIIPVKLLLLPDSKQIRICDNEI